MNLQRSQQRINELMSSLVAQIKGATAMTRTDINHVSETLLVPILGEIYGWRRLQNLNQTGKQNYPAIDLADADARVAVQVTASSSSQKILDTLRVFVSHKLYEKYDRLVVYVLTEKQRSYGGKRLRRITKDLFKFDVDQDIIDYRDLLRIVASSDMQTCLRVQGILEDHLGQSHAPLQVRSVGAPPLEMRTIPEDPHSLNRFYYGTRSTPFVGRQSELRRLSEFLDSNAAFSWWLLAGPGGLGKSRLALEFCLRIKTVWRAGFLPPSFDRALYSAVEPTRPTLLVADYAQARAGELGDIAYTLYLRSQRNELRHPVRLLLLERDPYGKWRKEFEGTGGVSHVIRAALYGGSGNNRDRLELRPLDEGSLWELIKFVLTKANVPLPDRADTLNSLRLIDPQGRPLFAFLSADALAAGRSLRDWNRTALLRDVLRREEDKRWAPRYQSSQGRLVLEHHKDLLAIATLLSGVELKPLLTLLQDSPIAYSPTCYQLLSGRRGVERLEPLEPDLLGEAFVLEHIRPRYVGDTERADTVLDAAWSSERKFQIVQMLLRCTGDFPDHESIELLCRQPNIEDAQIRLVWGVSVVTRFVQCGPRDIERARELYEELRAAWKKYPKDIGLPDLLANSAMFLATWYAESGETDKGHEIYEDFQQIQLRGLEATLQAKGAPKLGIAYIAAGNTDLAWRLWKDLDGLCRRYPDHVELRESRAVLGYELIQVGVKGLEKDELPEDKLEGVYSTLFSSTKNTSTSDVTFRVVAGAAISLLRQYHGSTNEARVPALSDQLTALAGLLPEDEMIAEFAAEALLLLIDCRRRASEWGETERLYDQMRALNENHPESSAIAERRAGAAAALLDSWRKRGQSELALPLLTDLRTLMIHSRDKSYFVRMLGIGSMFAGDYDMDGSKWLEAWATYHTMSENLGEHTPQVASWLLGSAAIQLSNPSARKEMPDDAIHPLWRFFPTEQTATRTYIVTLAKEGAMMEDVIFDLKSGKAQVVRRLLRTPAGSERDRSYALTLKLRKYEGSECPLDSRRIVKADLVEDELQIYPKGCILFYAVDESSVVHEIVVYGDEESRVLGNYSDKAVFFVQRPGTKLEGFRESVSFKGLDMRSADDIATISFERHVPGNEQSGVGFVESRSYACDLGLVRIEHAVDKHTTMVVKLVGY